VGDIVGISVRPGRKPKFLLGAEDTEGADEMEGGDDGAEDTEGADEMEGEGEGARVG